MKEASPAKLFILKPDKPGILERLVKIFGIEKISFFILTPHSGQVEIDKVG